MEGEADEGPERVETARMCIVTREVRPIAGLIRFVRGPDGALVPDIRNRLPGRGVWIANSAPILRQAVARKAFARGLKADVVVPADLEAQVAALLKRDALQMLSLANKAGALTTGFDKILGVRGRVLALVQASDGSEAEIARLGRHLRGKGPGGGEPAGIRAFSAEELGLSIGREHVIHAALTVHDAASVFVDRALRFVEFRAGGPAERHVVPASGPDGIGGVSAPE